MVKPSSAVFAEIAGVSHTDAVSILHGLVGSNTDTRDWGAIMASDDPLGAARAATAAMYGTPPGSGVVQTTHPATGQPRLQSGNFVADMVPVASTVSAYGGGSTEPASKETKPALYLVDKQGEVLRGAGDTAAQVSRNAWLFGFDLEPLRQLASALQAASPQLASQMSQASGAQFTAQGQPQLQLQPAGNTTPTTAVPAPAVETPVATGSDNAATAGTNASANELNRMLQEWISALRA
jgi:HAMP domain-containing protein